MSNRQDTDALVAARDALRDMTPDQLEHMLYDVRADHQYAVHRGSNDEREKLAILRMYERRAAKLGVHVVT